MRSLAIIVALACSFPEAFSQDNYEIQVYPSGTVAPGATMIEMHSNYTPEGRTFTNGVLPTEDALHETLEITHGFTDWMEIGFYLFTSVVPHNGWQWVGDHLRPRVRVPEEWNLPVGLSLSLECGYQRRAYAADTWTLEIRPILDKDTRLFYASFNPTLGVSLKGANSSSGVGFEPNLKVAWHAIAAADFGAEYYGDVGPVAHPDGLNEQSHALFGTVDLNLSPEWEINAGAGWGLTSSTDGLVLKLILGRRF